jgi:hypothetical protein
MMKVDMFIKSAMALAIAGSLVACGAPPKQVFPDGSGRVPANDPARIAEVKTVNAQQRGLQLENDALRIQNAALQRQMDDLRTAVTGVIASATRPTPQAAVPAQPQGPQSMQPQGQQSSPQQQSLPGQLQLPKFDMPTLPKLNKNEALPNPASNLAAVPELPDAATSDLAVWRRYNITAMTHLFAPGQTRIDYDALSKKGMLKDAQNAKLITVFAGTDSPDATLQSSKEALERGRYALAMLVGAGIPRERIKVEVASWGHFAVPNDTPEGRALNRRVDILFYEKQPADMQRWAGL